jgi:hypothetical protein
MAWSTESLTEKDALRKEEVLDRIKKLPREAGAGKRPV